MVQHTENATARGRLLSFESAATRTAAEGGAVESPNCSLHPQHCPENIFQKKIAKLRFGLEIMMSPFLLNLWNYSGYIICRYSSSSGDRTPSEFSQKIPEKRHNSIPNISPFLQARWLTMHQRVVMYGSI